MLHHCYSVLWELNRWCPPTPGTMPAKQGQLCRAYRGRKYNLELQRSVQMHHPSEAIRLLSHQYAQHLAACAVEPLSMLPAFGNATRKQHDLNFWKVHKCLGKNAPLS